MTLSAQHPVAKRRVLLTGGLGYLGGRIAQGLLADPNVDLLMVTRQKLLKRPEWLPGGTIQQIDFDNPADWKRACEGIDQVVHLVSPNAGDCGHDPEGAIRVNVIGTINVLGGAVAMGVKRFLYMSSAHVYGDLYGTITEKSLVTARHPYGITKQAAENFVLAAHESKKIEAIVFRLSNSFGTPTHVDVNAWLLLVNDLCRRAIAQKELLLRSSGVQVRDFIPIDDVVNAVDYALRLSSDKLDNGIFNLGGDDCVSIQTMAQRVASRCEAILGYRPPIRHPDPLPFEQSKFLYYSSEKLKATGFVPACRINDEIDATLRFCQRFDSSPTP
ncbi:NAD-dependent epimerase/dehydratase [bacterium]|jgi:UDP-glucose 4-epimerase|nr:NAD-dependent epimerase/dehydratase [bacterium]